MVEVLSSSDEDDLVAVGPAGERETFVEDEEEELNLCTETLDEILKRQNAENVDTSQVSHLNLDRQRIGSVDDMVFTGFGSVTNLYVQHNRVKNLAFCGQVSPNPRSAPHRPPHDADAGPSSSSLLPIDCLFSSDLSVCRDLPRFLAQLANLRFLCASNNELERVDGLNGLRGLRVLDVSHNRITRVTPEDLPPSLQFLMLAGNPCAGEGTVMEGLKAMPSLIEVDGKRFKSSIAATGGQAKIFSFRERRAVLADDKSECWVTCQAPTRSTRTNFVFSNPLRFADLVLLVFGSSFVSAVGKATGCGGWSSRSRPKSSGRSSWRGPG